MYGIVRRQRWISSRSLQTDALSLGKGLSLPTRQHRENIWIPQASLKEAKDGIADAGDLLVRAGFLRQAYSGIFHLLPLGLRVQSKLEALIDKHMSSLRASKVSLSSFSSQKLWDKSGRLSGSSEFFKFKDRKDAQWLLAPTHEEEITTLVKSAVFAPAQLPLRLYQVGRKYRDEKRPRGGLLRGREFMMKDLYSFDKDEPTAIATYAEVRKAYTNLFDELKVPYIEASADSGNMGGNLSHEFHLPSPAGEDNVITCTKCSTARNEEFVPPFETTAIERASLTNHAASPASPNLVVSDYYLSDDRKTLVRVFAQGDPSDRALNPYAIKSALSKHDIKVDTGLENRESQFNQQLQAPQPGQRLVYLFDNTFASADIASILDNDRLATSELGPTALQISDPDTTASHLLAHRAGDPCPSCNDGTLQITKAIEVGHTFHLGTRYSSKLAFHIPGTRDLVQMGCHGIGVSRLIAATAAVLSDSTGLMWPRAIAPFEVAVLVDRKNEGAVKGAEGLYDQLTDGGVDTLIDGREEVGLGWKLKDADLIGYCVVVVFGKGWREGRVEVQCRRLKIKEDVRVEDAQQRVAEILARL